MKKLWFCWAGVAGMILALSVSPLSGQDDPARASRPASRQFGPPVDIVPLNLDRIDLPEEQKGLEAMVQYPGNSLENKYRGCVAANVDNGTQRDELIVDFGAGGVWVHSGFVYGGQWYQISAANPDWIISARWGDVANEEIIGAFGALGLWVWSYSGYPGAWTQISGSSPSQGLAVDDDGDGKDEIQVDFGAVGLWRYDADTGAWVQFSGFDPLAGGIRKNQWTTAQEEGAWSFPGLGVWSFQADVSGNPAIWQLAGNDAAYPNVSAELGIGDDSEEMVVSFGPALGLWLAEEGTYPAVTWQQISAFYPTGAGEVRFAGAPDYEVLIDFTNAAGLWLWDSGSWEMLSAADPGDGFFEPFDPNGFFLETSGDEEVAIDFDAQGLWLYDRTSGAFAQLTAANPVYMVRGDFFDSGTTDEWLIVDFGTAGLWAYDGYSNSWHQLSGLSPD
jgi:hypothetical protein